METVEDTWSRAGDFWVHGGRWLKPEPSQHLNTLWLAEEQRHTSAAACAVSFGDGPDCFASYIDTCKFRGKNNKCIYISRTPGALVSRYLDQVA